MSPLGRVAALTAALLLSTVSAAAQDAPRGRVSGRVLDRDQGTPIAMAVVRVTAGGSEAATATSDAEGRYSVPLPAGQGPFSLRAERLGYIPLTVVIPADEAAAGAWRDLRLTAQAVALAPVSVRQRRPDRQEIPGRAPGGTDETRVSWAPTSVPLDPGDLAALAALEGGVQAVDGGVSFLAQSPSQTRTTLDGASFGATTLPQEAIATTSIVGSTYDVSRGQFSGGMIAATTLSGTNLFGGALRSRFSHPQIQWRTRTPSGRPESAFVHGEGGGGGAIVANRLFWYAAFSASYRSTPLVALENASPAVLEGFGVHPDSAARVTALLREGFVSPAAGRLTDDGSSEHGTALLRLDYDFADTHSLMLRVDGRRTQLDGLGVSPLATLASGGTARDGGAGVLTQLTSRVGPVDNELRVYWAEESRSFAPAWPGPAGTVRVAAGAGSAAGTSLLRFGGSLSESEYEGSLLELTNQSTAALGRGHELKAGLIISAQDASVLEVGNRFGTFTFNSVDDFRNGDPALFTRTLGAAEGDARARYAALYLGDVWQRGRLGITYGARVEGRWYRPFDGPAAARLPFDVKPGRIPSEWGVSPRLGWSYEAGGWSLQGGVGEFRGNVPLQSLAAALGQTGVTNELLLTCVGAAAPAPEWARYQADPASVPAACTDGESAFAGRTPPLTVFRDDFAAPRAWRASVGGMFPLLERLRVNVDASLTRGVSQGVARDLNVDPIPAFRLAGEGGRPVYAPPSTIDVETGGVAPGASRPFAEWGAVREISAGGGSSVAQARVGVTLVSPAGVRARAPRLSGTYTFTRAFNEVGGLHALEGSSPFASDPARLTRGTSELERRHDVQLRLVYSPVRWAQIGVLGRLTSGSPFTPRVDGDVNGDGTLNDPAFVFDPALVADTSLASGLSRVLEEAPGRIGACLRRQLGRVAQRNSCRSGWTSSLDLRTDFQFWRSGVTRRMRLTVTTSNALGLLDRVVNGRDGLRGWGEPPAVDPVLLRVRGFDAAAPAWQYEVNPAFGTRSATLARFRRPFTLTIEGRITVGSDPAYQSLQKLVNQALGAGRSAEEIRHELSRRIPNVPAQVVALDAEARLGLTAEQRDRLLDRADSLGGRLAPLADSLAVALSGLEARRRSAREAQKEVDNYLRQIREALEQEVATIRQLLTSVQWERLPEAVRVPDQQILPPRGLRAPVTIGG